MGSEWVVQKISSLGEFDRGKSKHRPRDAKHLYGGSFPFIQTGDVTNSNGRITTYRQTYNDAGLAQSRLWPVGTLAITIAANIAETALLTFPACFPDSVVGFTADPKKADIRFVEYLFQAMRKQVKSHAYGSVQENINLDVLRKLEFPIPTLDVQTAIADHLSVLDDRITLLRETNKTLEAIAQTIFKSWFIDFDPVRAKMEGRAPAGMDEETAELFPDELVESELGLIPKGWVVGRVGDIGEVICGKTPSTAVVANYGNHVPFITIPDMHGLLVVTDTTRMLSKLGADSQIKKYLPPGSVCVSCIATAGLVVQVTKESQTNQQINSVIPMRKWGSAYPLFLLRRIGEAVRSGGSGGSVFYNLNKSGFEQLPVLLATPQLAQFFDTVVDPLIRTITQNQVQAVTLTSLRDTLLPRLISGKLRVPENEVETPTL
jgi:type I restriction enzyme S subunit